MFGRATIRLGIGPHSSKLCITTETERYSVTHSDEFSDRAASTESALRPQAPVAYSEFHLGVNLMKCCQYLYDIGKN